MKDQTHNLLKRDDFRRKVFKRDGYRCGNPADAHRIIERRLFPDGGYYINNGASVCEPCHYECEKNIQTTKHWMCGQAIIPNDLVD